MKKVALVTGASSGIGEATVRKLMARGYVVYAAARRVDRMKAVQAGGARLLALDVTDDDAMVSAVAEIERDAGRLDALVNAAGYGAYGALEDVPLSEGRQQFEVNLFGLARLTQLALPLMRKQGAGRIVNITSIGGKIHEPMGSWYHATKFAVEGLSDCLRLELRPFGIDVVVIEPGAIRTEWSPIARATLLQRSGGGPYAEQARVSADLLAGADRGASPPSVVANVVWSALRARRPKTRYAVGRGAKIMLWLRWLMSDNAFDNFMRRVSARVAQAEAQRQRSS